MMFSKKQLFYTFLAIIGILSVILNSFVLYYIRSSWNHNVTYVSTSKSHIPQTPLKVSHNAESGLTRYRTEVVDSIMDAIRSYTDDVSGAWDWIIEKYPSVLTKNAPDVEHVVKEYIKSKITVGDDWIVVRSVTLPNHKLRIKKIPLRVDNVDQYAGYLDTSSASFFFWLVDSRQRPESDPLIIWLNGGPGCSSLIGFFLTIGPAKWYPKKNIFVYNPYSWNDKTTLVALDQPANTGFSYSNRTVDSTIDAVGDFIAFLSLLYQQFPKLSKLPLHLAGESYAGHYLPMFAAGLIEMNDYADEDETEEGEIDQNKRIHSFLYKRKSGLKSEKSKVLSLYPRIMASLYKESRSDTQDYSNATSFIKFPLVSLMIGNGYVDPLHQMPYNYLVGCNGRYPPVFNASQCKQMERDSHVCRRYLLLCKELLCPCVCVYAYNFCVAKTLTPYTKAHRNIYDVRIQCQDCALGDIKSLEAYLNQSDVRQTLGVNKPYSACNTTIANLFYRTGEMSEGVISYIYYLFNAGIRILVFSGDADIICNWYGSYVWTHMMKWSGSEEFTKMKLRPWVLRNNRGKKPKGTHVGEVKSSSYLTLVRVYKAGHSVGLDQPESAFDLYRRWMTGDYSFKEIDE